MVDGSLIDFVLPVGVRSSKKRVGRGILTIIVLDEFTVFAGLHYIELVEVHAHTKSAVIAYEGLLMSLTLTAFLCGDDDDTVRTAATVNGGG